MELKVKAFKQSEHKRSYGYQAKNWRGGYTWVTNRRSSDRPDGHSIVYVDFVDESISDNLANRTSRPYNLVRPLVEAELRKLGIEFEKISWSRTAGCTCPCSPGFLIRSKSERGHDFWIEVECDEDATVDHAEAAHRRAQVEADPTLASIGNQRLS